MLFKSFYSAYDTQGIIHNGFLQSMNFSALSPGVTFINELTMAMMDAYLFNEYSHSVVMKQWRDYMTYSKTNDRLEINANFYTDFVNAIGARLIKLEKFWQLTKTDFTSLSAIDIKTIEHGEKETETERGQGQKTNIYGAQKTTRDYDKVVVDFTREQDSHTIGAAHTATSGTTTGQIYPLGASAFIDDTKQTTSDTMDSNAQTNTDSWGDTSTETAARKDEESKISHTDIETDAARTDTQTIHAYTDTERHTKHIIIAPEKYYEISKELADIGAYDLMRDAVKDTMLLCVWREEYIWN